MLSFLEKNWKKVNIVNLKVFLKTVVLDDKQNNIPTAFPPLFSKKFELDTFTKHCTFKGLPYVCGGFYWKENFENTQSILIY